MEDKKEELYLLCKECQYENKDAPSDFNVEFPQDSDFTEEKHPPLKNKTWTINLKDTNDGRQES